MGNFNQQRLNTPNLNSDIPNPNVLNGMYMQQNVQNLPPVNNQSKSKKPLIIAWVIAGVAVSAVVLIGLFSVFVPVFGQTLAARTMDAMGFHGVAMKLDAITQKDKTMVALASINPKKPETCGDVWQYVDNFSPPRLEAMQFKNYISIVPVYQKYAQDFSFDIYLEARMSMIDERAIALMEINGRLNGDKINSMLEEIEPGSSSPQLAGNFQISAIGEAYLDTTGVAFKLSKLNVEGKNLNVKDSSDSWYKSDFNLTRLQKEGVSELLGVLMDLSEARTTDMLEESTGRTILTNTCRVIDKIEIKGPQNVEIGKDRQKFNVRPVVYTLNQDFTRIQQEISPEVLKAVVNDQKLPDFIKSKHPEVVRISKALGKIDRSFPGEIGEITKAQFDREVDFLFENLKKQLTDENLKDAFSSDNDMSVDPGFEVIIEPIEVFADVSTGFVVGTRSTHIIKPTDRILKNIPEGESKNFIKEGFKVTQEVYDIAYNQDVPTIEVISGSVRTIDQMPKDFRNFMKTLP